MTVGPGGTAVELAAAVAAGDQSARAIIDEHLERIEAADGEIHAFNMVVADRARETADGIDRAVAAGEPVGPLAGLPVALKDNFCTNGIPTTCSSKILDGWVPPYDATAVERLEAAGAVVIGKTNLDEFAMGSSTENSAFGPTRNPLDPSRVPGGSSGGSAAAVAAGFAPLAFGSDTGGSIRQPAALCGVVGLKPTYGAVSRYGLVAFASSLDQIGPFARTVADTALAYDAVAGPDPRDSTSLADEHRPVLSRLGDGVDGLRVGLVAEMTAPELRADRGGAFEPEVIDRCHEAAEALAGAGAKVEEVSIPSAIAGLAAYYMIAPAEASSNLARYDGVRYGHREPGPNTAAMMTASRTAGFGDEVKRRIMLGTYALSAGYYDAFYGKAQRIRTLMIREFDQIYQQYDVLLSPTSPCVAFPFGAKADPLTMYYNDVCTIPCNLTGHPAISVPFGTGAEGLARRGPGDGSEAVRGGPVPGGGRPRGHRGWGIDRGGGRMTATETTTEAGRGHELLPDGWEMVIGLEVHAELATRSKMFSPAPNAFGGEPNTNVHPVCLGLPGTLPVVNGKAIELGIRIGLALDCTIQRCVFARKNYFYPDMPKDYQISQYELALNVDGRLELADGSVIGIERAHLEEDTGKSTHVGASGRIHDAGYSLVDYNRAGVPLIEIVSRPDLRDPEQAKAYVEELRAILVAIGASDGKMEEGSLRVDANVSVRPVGSDELRTRCEIKNVNSLRSLGRAITYEARRHVDLYQAGDAPRQETRHWDEEDGRTRAGRSKEEAEDYRYFDDPDLVPVDPSPEWVDEIRAALPALPRQRRQALIERGASTEGAALAVERQLDELALAAIEAGADPERTVTHVANNLAVDGAESLDPSHFAQLVTMEVDGALTATQAKQVLAEMVSTGQAPAAIAADKGFEAMDSSELETLLDQIIADHPDEWERFKEGEKKLQGVFVGQIMKATKGQADGKVVNQLLNQKAGS